MKLTRDQAVELACGIQGWMNRDELYWLYDRAGEIPEGGLWVEIGTWKGRSALATALGLSKDSSIFCIDSFEGNTDSTAHWESQIPDWLISSFRLVKNVICKLRLDVKVNLADCSSLGIAEYWSNHWDGIPNAVFIDASHLYEDVKADIEVWRELLKPGGLLCGHDYCGDYPGVKQAVDESLPGVELAPHVYDAELDHHVLKGTIWHWRKPACE